MAEASNSSRLALGMVVVVTAVAVGCGLSDLTEGVFSGGSTTNGAGGGGTTSTTGGDTTTTTTTTTTSTGGDQGGAGGAGGAGGSATTTTSTSTGSSGGTLDCGDGLTCPQGMDSACCWSDFQSQGMCIQGPPDPATCNTAPQNGGFRTRIECQLPSHCPQGTVCCADRVPLGGGNAYYASVTCQAQCPAEDRLVCDPASPVCPTGICVDSSLLPDGYSVCTGN